MSILKQIIINISGKPMIQYLLEKHVISLQYIMGIGSGSVVSSSGEEAAFTVLKKRYKPPYCIFDVGANKGQFLQLALQQLSDDNITIHCFEPGQNTFKILKDSFNDRNRIILNNIGIGIDKGEATLHYDSIGSGLASLTKRNLDHYNIDFNQSETIQLNTIDNYCNDNAIDHIHLLKIDIEGHEMDALAGAKRMFDSKLIDIVMFEFGGCNIDTRSFFQDFWYFLNNHAFEIFRITPSGSLFHIKSYKEYYEQFRTTNFLAILNRA